MTFALLQQRLIENVRTRLRNGELTERGFARQIGVSQPHIHNVLKGVRILTPKLADRIMAQLGLTILELAQLGEVRIAAQKLWLGQLDLVPVPIAGKVGPGLEWPDANTTAEWVLLNRYEIARIGDPVGILLGLDPALPWEIGPNTLALISQDEETRRNLEAQAWYAICRQGEGLVRQARYEQDRWLVGSIPVPATKSHQMGLVRGRVAWVGEDPRQASRLSQRGLFLPAAAT